MANFCTRCGRPLSPGEECGCQAKNEEKIVTEQSGSGFTRGIAAQANVDANDFQQAEWMRLLGDAVNRLKILAKKPVSEGKIFVSENNFQMAFAFVIFQALSVALFVVVLESKVSQLASNLMNGFGDLGVLLGYAIPSMSFSYVSNFFMAILLSTLLSGALAGLLYLVSGFFKNAISFKQAFCITSMRSVVTVPVAIIATVVNFVSPLMGIVALLMANIWAYCVLVQLIPSKRVGFDDLKPLMVFLVALGFLIVSVFAIYQSYEMFVPSF